MENKNIIAKLRINNGYSQEELAKKINVTRQAISRWENYETTPNPETLKALSELFNVSIDKLLGSDKNHICQCCGMPLDDVSIISNNKDGSVNPNYCKWCYADGTFTYHNMNELIDVCIKHMKENGFDEAQAREYMNKLLPTLDYWKNYESLSDNGEYEEFKDILIKEINDLNIEGLPKITSLFPLVGSYINIEYILPNGNKIKFLDNNKTYLGNELICEYDDSKCFGVVADMGFILVATYEKDGGNPELIIYKKR